MISIAQAKRIREELGMTHIVILGIDKDGMQHVATHGETEKDAYEAADIGNALKMLMGWPEEHCNMKPLERICQNCESYAEESSDCINPQQDKVKVEKTDNCPLFNPNDSL